MTHVVRTHFIAPKDLIEETDRLVGARRRSRFISEAVAEKLQREKLLRGVHRKAAAAAGRTLSVSDSLLAALAKEHDATLLTSNIKDYAGNDVRVLSLRDATS